MHVDVAVIGRGMIGAAAARHLAEGGTHVALIGPPEPIDRMTSEGPFNSHPDEGRITRIAGRTGAWSELAAAAIGRYPDIARRSGIAFHTPCGLVTGYHDADSWIERARPLGSQARRVDADWVRETTGIHITSDLPLLHEPAPAGHINPRRLVAAQTLLTAHAGGIVISQAATALRRASGTYEIAGDWGGITATRVLIATGAFGAHLIEAQVAVERRPRTTVMAALAPDPSLPSLILDGPPDPRVSEIYWVPPVRFPDGVDRIKIGGTYTASHDLETSDLVAWFHTDGDPDEAEALAANLHALLPDASLGSHISAPCVVTATATGHPFIGWVEGSDDLAVAIAGNGSAAKSSDEIGRIAASLFGPDGWDSPISHAEFAPRFL